MPCQFVTLNLCFQLSSYKMLDIATKDTDDLYWEAKVAQTPKRKRAHINEEFLDNSILMVKMAVSQKKNTLKLALKSSPSAASEVEALLRIVQLPYYFNLTSTKIINSQFTNLIW